MMRAMVFKIVSFMSWFHLSALMITDMPNIKDFITDKLIYKSFYIYLLVVILIILSLLYNIALLKVAGIAFVGSELFYLYILISAIKRYNFYTNKNIK